MSINKAQQSIVRRLNDDKEISFEALECYKNLHPENLSGNYHIQLVKLLDRLFEAEIDFAYNNTETYLELYTGR
jgi:hypothetical protein